MDSRKVQLLIRVDDTLKTEVTEEEKQFRESKFANENVILKQKVLCTACGIDLKDKITLRYQINIHPVLEVLWCKKCEEFYDDGNFSMDEDGSDKYCRWCAQGGQLYCCSHCSIAFCANCIKRNFKRTKIMKDIEDDEWQCFVCDTEPLWTLRAICDASKRYVESHLNRRKSRRSVKLNESDEDTAETVDSEASSTRTRRGKQNAKQTVANSKSTTESEENVSAEVNKRGKRKRASSGEETPTKSRGKRGKSREDVEPTENADQKRKKSFENFIVEAINDFGTFRKILSKKELSLKKEYLGKDISQLDEIIVKAQEEFSKVCHDAKTSLENIEKKIADQLLTLRKTPEDDKKSDAEPESPSKDPLAPSDEPDEPSNETATDVTQPEHDTQSDKPTIGISDKSPTPSVNGKPEENGNDMSLTIISDEEPPNEKTEEATKSTTSVNDSLAVNISSIIESLKTDDDSRITENLRDRNINDDTTVIDDIEMIDDTAPDDVEMIDDPKETTRDNSEPQKDQVPENSAIASPEIDKSPLIKDKISKMALLQSSSDNASSSDNEGAKVKSSDSDLSGVSVLHSDPDEANTTKRKKRKKRKELDQLGAKLKSKKERAETDEDAEIDRLTNLDSLKKRKKRGASSESGDSENDKSETENVDGEKEKNSVSKKKNSDKENGGGESKDGEESAKKKKKCLSSSEKKKKNSMLDYFSQSDQDSDASNASFSKFSSFIENKHKAFLVGKDELSKKCLLSSSEEEQLENGDKSENDSPKKSSVKKGRPAREAAPKKSMIITTDEEAEEEEKKKKDKKKDKSKWRSDSLLKSKVSETDTSDEERMIERERRRRQKEAEQSKNKNSSDSEDLFRPKKRETSAKKRKAKVASSGSEFDVDKAEESDDSVQIISEDEKPIAKKKKRRRIKKFNDSDSSADENDKESNAPGSASKGRKHIRKILKEEDLAELTKRMAKEEEERKKRIAERQALFNESFQMEKVEGEQLTKLVLDFDSKTKEELISVHPNLVKKLKPHQAKGVKFMWDSCFESVKMARTTPGGGCILAHCMGLGKTLQVITLVHTVMRYPELNVQRVLVICPLSTVLNWKAEFDLWLRDVEDGDDINIFHLKKNSNNVLRADHLNNWFREGGVMILGYEMFRNLINTTKCKKKIKEYFLESLVDPGPDLVICDEGHMLKNEATALSQAAMKIKTKRRIVLTGTPLQNNLKEYHCMVQFVKPNLLGDKKEFLNRFANPITNGQYSDSTSHDVRVMKRRAHVLHKMLDGIVQRFDYNVLTPFLPNKHEFVIMVALSDLQAKLYQYYIDHFSKKVNPQSRLLKDYQTMRLIWTHPLAMKLGEERSRKLEEKKDYDSEGSLKDFVVHSSDESDDSDDDKSDNSVVSIKSDDSRKGQPKRRLTRAKKKELGITDEDLCVLDNDNDDNRPAVWWKSMINEEEMEDYKLGPKLILLFAILKHCENIGDKLLVFSQSIPSLDMIEYFLKNLEETPNKDDKQEESDSFGTWEKGADYFRLDGQTAPELRTMYCNAFNKTSNLRARLFLISTKAGGLGINLTAANRVVIFDASWNPSYDVQSIFRVYRFGQNKPCYIYRFLSQGTMEEKIYERQVTKLSISCRVVDEQQIDRHFNNADVESLYEFNRKKPSQDEIPKLPKDRLMAELLKEYKDIILTYLEHDSLLENIAEEELTEEERKQAWEDYENEKKGKVMNLQNQQFTMTAAQADFMFHKDTIMAALKKEHPNVSDDQLQVMYTMVRDKLKMHYIAQLQAQQQQQLRAAQAAQMANQAVQMAQMANQANKAADPLAQQKHAAYVQNLQLKNQFDQQVKDRLQAATYAAKNAGSTSQK